MINPAVKFSASTERRIKRYPNTKHFDLNSVFFTQNSLYQYLFDDLNDRIRQYFSLYLSLARRLDTGRFYINFTRNYSWSNLHFHLDLSKPLQFGYEVTPYIDGKYEVLQIVKMNLDQMEKFLTFEAMKSGLILYDYNEIRVPDLIQHVFIDKLRFSVADLGIVAFLYLIASQ